MAAADPRQAAAPDGSVWPVAQHSDAAQRGDRYRPETAAHPDRTLPALAARIITRHTAPGDIVADPLAGTGTTLVEAAHRGRHAVGVELVPQWVSLASDNLRLARRQGATGHTGLTCGDATQLPALLPERLRGNIALILAALPRRTRPAPARPEFRQLRSWARANAAAGGASRTRTLDHASPDRALGLLTEMVAGCAAVLRPGGVLVVCAQPWRGVDWFIDVPGYILAAGEAAGLTILARHIAALTPMPARARINAAPAGVRLHRDGGPPSFRMIHQDVIVMRADAGGRSRAAHHDTRNHRGNP